jgi:hypothetical protein
LSPALRKLQKAGSRFVRSFALDPRADALPSDELMTDPASEGMWSLKNLKLLAHELGVNVAGKGRQQVATVLARLRDAASHPAAVVGGASDPDFDAVPLADATNGVDAAAAEPAAAGAEAPLRGGAVGDAAAAARETPSASRGVAVRRLAASARAEAAVEAERRATIIAMGLGSDDSDDSDARRHHRRERSGRGARESATAEVKRLVAEQQATELPSIQARKQQALASAKLEARRARTAAKREADVKAAVASQMAAWRQAQLEPAPHPRPAKGGRDKGVPRPPPVELLQEESKSPSDSGSDSDSSTDSAPEEVRHGAPKTAADLRADTARHAMETVSSQVNTVAYMTHNLERNRLLRELDVSHVDPRSLTPARVYELRNAFILLIREFQRPEFLAFEPKSGDRLQHCLDFADSKLTAPDITLLSLREALQSTVLRSSDSVKHKDECDKFMTKFVKTASANATRLENMAHRGAATRFIAHDPPPQTQPHFPPHGQVAPAPQWVYGLGQTAFALNRGGGGITCHTCGALGHYHGDCPQPQGGRGGRGGRGGGRGGGGGRGRGRHGQPQLPPPPAGG